jgi:hypothetical protein
MRRVRLREPELNVSRPMGPEGSDEQIDVGAMRESLQLI